MKPLLTHSNPTLMETMPSCCLGFSRMLTSTEQLSRHPAMVGGTLTDDLDPVDGAGSVVTSTHGACRPAETYRNQLVDTVSNMQSVCLSLLFVVAYVFGTIWELVSKWLFTTYILSYGS